MFRVQRSARLDVMFTLKDGTIPNPRKERTMIEVIPDLPDRVLGLKASGQVSAEDYQNGLVPALEEKLRKLKKVRLLYLLGDGFEGYTGSAAWQDAKVGMKHLTAFERVAIVTDVERIAKAVKAFGFVMPGEVRVFETEDLNDARVWISEASPTSDLRFELVPGSGVLILEPQGELETGDFERLNNELDPYIAEAGGLKGFVVIAKHFPGWDDFAAMLSHLRFVKDHHSKIRKVAFVSDDRLLSVLPRIAGQFLVAETRTFPMSERDAAMLWVGQP